VVGTEQRKARLAKSVLANGLSSTVVQQMMMMMTVIIINLCNVGEVVRYGKL